VVKVLFVCLGNICRSPTAEGVFRALVEDAGLGGVVEVDSAGTSDWHIGEPPDQRGTEAARRRGYDLSNLRARQVKAGDFDRFDYVIAMDQANLAKLSALAPVGTGEKLSLFLAFAPEIGKREVPDPYYGGPQDFDDVLDMIEVASRGLLADICARHL
ncbi:MAG: low molecular weight protein-tyrosine-phosphatase, partial [Rhodospirillaceae bacterium]